MKLLEYFHTVAIEQKRKRKSNRLVCYKAIDYVFVRINAEMK